MTEFKKGQRVHVEYVGVIQDTHPELLWVHPDDPDVGAFSVPVKAVTLADPKDWPPQVGDIWEGRGMEWFARKGELSDNMILAPERGDDDWTQQEFKALNPILVRRREA